MTPKYLLGSAFLLASCDAGYQSSDFRHEVSVAVDDGGGVEGRFVAAIDSATTSLDVAIPYAESTAIADAIVRAHERGVAVRAITDVDVADQAGAVRLIDADVPLRLADGDLAYFDFSINADVAFDSGLTRMSHAWALVDRERAVVSTEAGGTGDGKRVVLDVRGEDLLEDLWTEHNQVYGGIDATAATAYDNPAKSVADFRWSYPTDSDVRLELWFGPQERLTKRLIDAVYGARASVWIQTGLVDNDGLIRVLQAKAADDFDVKVVVGTRQPTVYNPRSPADVFANGTPDVEKLRVDDEEVPTVVIVDAVEARDGVKYPTRVFVLSHELVSAVRLFDGAPVVNDQLIDGNLWVIEDTGEEAAIVRNLRTLFEDSLSRGGAL
jgi:phosphatidylserine/phosphatidylglycerophosphate/cardiolipin synthase-like enzyme